MKPLGASIGGAADLGPLLIRLGVGAVFAVHGWQTFDDGVSGFAGFLESLDVPAPELVAWLQTFAEGVGGVLLHAAHRERAADDRTHAHDPAGVAHPRQSVRFLGRDRREGGA